MQRINILDIKPHVVSKSLKGYSVFFYGPPKCGKTTISSQFPKALLLAFEKGYNALPGVMAADITSWADFKYILTQLKSKEAHEQYSTIVIDTADIAYSLCEKYVCSNAIIKKNGSEQIGVDNISDIPFGKGYGMVENEFDNALRMITQLNYGLVIISHEQTKKLIDENGDEYGQLICPTLDKRSAKIVNRLVDLLGYAKPVTDAEGNTSTKLLLRGNEKYIAGSRFKHTPTYIDFDYETLVDTIANAAEAVGNDVGKEFITEEYIENTEPTNVALDFDKLMETFNAIANKRLENAENKEHEASIITEIVEKFIGRGNKVNDMSRHQVDTLSLIVDALSE